MSRPSRVSTWSNLARLALSGCLSTSAPQTSPRKVVKSRAITCTSAGANDAKRSSAWRVSALDHVRYSTRWPLRASTAFQEHRRLSGPRAAADQADRAVVLDEVDLLVRPRSPGDVPVQMFGRRQRQIVADTARRQRGVVVVMSHVPHQDGALRQVERPGGRAAARRPPQVVLHAVVAAQRRSTPAAVRVHASLDDGRPAVRGEMLEDDAQPLVEVRPPAQAIGDLGMHPEPVTQVPELHVSGVGRRVGPESQPRSTAWSGRGGIIDLGETEKRRLRLLAERVGDPSALGGGQRELVIARATGIQAEHPPRRFRDVTHMDIEALRQLLDGLPAVDRACPVGPLFHAGMVPRVSLRQTPGSRRSAAVPAAEMLGCAQTSPPPRAAFPHSAPREVEQGIRHEPGGEWEVVLHVRS